MEENNNSNFQNANEYRKVSNVNTSRTKSKGSSGRVFVPFCSGVIGAALVVGTCFGVPSIKEKLIGKTTYNSFTESASTQSVSSNATPVSLSNYSDTAVSVAEKVLPSVVGIKVQYSVNSFWGITSSAEASGSGVIISSDGYIVTNNHVVNSSDSSSYYQVSEANKITVTLYNDSTEYEAKIVGTDSQTDLAVIKIDKTDLSCATLGNSDSCKVGEVVLAIGNPLNMKSSVTSGIISALNREVKDSDGQTFTLTQTDAAINSGNSGGALVNSAGEVIGINQSKFSGTGIEGMGFAIPINSAKPITQELISDGKVKRPFVGITGRDVNEKTAKANNIVEGIYIVAIEPFSAAEKAALKIGDIIIEADGTSVKTMEEFNKIKNTHSVGDTMKIKINRNGTEMDMDIVLQEQP